MQFIIAVNTDQGCATVHFPAFAITQHVSTHWMPLNRAMSKYPIYPS